MNTGEVKGCGNFSRPWDCQFNTAATARTDHADYAPGQENTGGQAAAGLPQGIGRAVIRDDIDDGAILAAITRAMV